LRLGSIPPEEPISAHVCDGGNMRGVSGHDTLTTDSTEKLEHGSLSLRVKVSFGFLEGGKT
jgi:hypothetical protein